MDETLVLSSASRLEAYGVASWRSDLLPSKDLDPFHEDPGDRLIVSSVQPKENLGAITVTDVAVEPHDGEADLSGRPRWILRNQSHREGGLAIGRSSGSRPYGSPPTGFGRPSLRRGFRRAAQILAVGVFGALAACASSDQSLSDRLAGADRVQGDADGVSVFKTDSVADALPLAVGHCAKFHRSAQYASRNGDTIKFRCVVEPASG